MAGNDKSPFKFWLQAAGLAISAYSAYNQNKRTNAKDKRDQAQLSKYNAQFDERLDAYEKSEFQPLDADALKQENIYEDLTVDTQAADYAKEQFQQQQANIMQGLRGVAGGSGVAGLAQSLSNQAAQQSQQSQLTIGQQLQQNRRMQMQEQSRLQGQERQIQLSNMQGAKQFEQDKMSTLMGVGGAQGAVAGNQAARGQVMSAVGKIGSSAIGADWSDAPWLTTD
jgi:hypothetical protein